jgi:hypothetical protein
MVVIGLALGFLGWFLKTNTEMVYGWAMIAGVVIFGVGFLTVVYSMIRSVEYHSIMEERSHAK